MKLVIALLLVLVAVPAWAQEKPAAPVPPPVLSEGQQLRAENFKLRVEIAQLRATVADRENRIAALTLSAEQATLASEFLTAVKAPEGSVWDWAAMAPKPKDKEK